MVTDNQKEEPIFSESEDETEVKTHHDALDVDLVGLDSATQIDARDRELTIIWCEGKGDMVTSEQALETLTDKLADHLITDTWPSTKSQTAKSQSETVRINVTPITTRFSAPINPPIITAVCEKNLHLKSSYKKEDLGDQPVNLKVHIVSELVGEMLGNVILIHSKFRPANTMTTDGDTKIINLLLKWIYDAHAKYVGKHVMVTNGMHGQYMKPESSNSFDEAEEKAQLNNILEKLKKLHARLKDELCASQHPSTTSIPSSYSEDELSFKYDDKRPESDIDRTDTETSSEFSGCGLHSAPQDSGDERANYTFTGNQETGGEEGVGGGVLGGGLRWGRGILKRGGWGGIGGLKNPPR